MRFSSDQERKQWNSRNGRAGSMGGNNSHYGPKGDGPGSYVKTGYRYATTRSPGGRGSNRKQIGVYTWMPEMPEPQAAKPAPEPETKPEPAPEPQSSEQGESPDYLQEARKRWSAQDDSSPKLMNASSSGTQAAADYGNKATDDYAKRFLPQMKAQSDLEALEIGRSGGDAIRKFVGEPPKLGDPKDLFNFYSDKINSAVD